MIEEVDAIPMVEEDEGVMIGFGKYNHVKMTSRYGTVGIFIKLMPLFNKTKLKFGTFYISLYSISQNLSKLQKLHSMLIRMKAFFSLPFSQSCRRAVSATILCWTFIAR